MGNCTRRCSRSTSGDQEVDEPPLKRSHLITAEMFQEIKLTSARELCAKDRVRRRLGLGPTDRIAPEKAEGLGTSAELWLKFDKTSREDHEAIHSLLDNPPHDSEWKFGRRCHICFSYNPNSHYVVQKHFTRHGCSMCDAVTHKAIQDEWTRSHSH